MTIFYRGVYFSERTNQELMKLVASADGRPKLPLHATTAYSRNPLPPPVGVLDRPVLARPEHFVYGLFGPQSNRQLVLTFRCDFVENRFDWYMLKGATYDYQKFYPHVALCRLSESPTVFIPPKPLFDIEIVEEYAMEFGDA